MDTSIPEKYQELASLFESLVKEAEILQENQHLFVWAGRVGSYPQKGVERYTMSGYSAYSGRNFNNNMLIQLIKPNVLTFLSTPKIYDCIVRNNLWLLNSENYEADCKRLPSITSNLIAGFLARNFELNDYRFIVTPDSFNKTFNELITFFEHDTIKITTYLGLYGPSGDIDSFHLTEQVSIEKGSYEIIKQFGLSYSSSDEHHIEMFEGDYVLRVNYEVAKTDYRNVYTPEQTVLEKWFHFCLLAENGNVEPGKKLLISEGWPLLNLKAPSSNLYTINLYSIHNKSSYSFSASSLDWYHEIAGVIDESTIEKLDNKIIFSMERLRKAKSAKNINDRIVELSLSFEYLINTTNADVTLQLCLKAILLLDDNNTDPTIFKKLKKFYALRSNVVHGNSKIEITPDNLTIVDFAETTIRRMLVKLIQLNKQYSLALIDEALKTAMHVKRPLKELLAETNQ